MPVCAGRVIDMKRYIKSNRDDEYFGQIAYDKYGDMILSKLNGKTVSKSRALAEEPGGLIYEANKLGIDMWDLLEALEGMCYNGTAREIDDSTYRVGKIGVNSSTNIKADVNSYSYTGDGFADDTIILAEYSDDDGYVELGKDLSTCYVTSQSFIGDHDFYREYPMSDIDTAIRDFNQEIKYFGGQRVLRRSAVEFELNKYGESLNDYVNSATNTCNIASKPVFGDDDFEEDDFSETYTVYGYYGRNFTGLSDSEDFDNLSQAEDYVWELLQNGAYVELVGPDSTRRFSPDKLDESREVNGEVYDITDAEINF